MEKREYYTIKEVAPGVQMVQEAGLGVMYLVKGESRGLVIDTGTGIGDFKALAEQELGGLPYDVVLTHGHVDHAGGIGQFAQVYVHPADAALAASLTPATRQDYIRRMLAVGAVDAALLSPEAAVAWAGTPTLLPLEDGAALDLGGLCLTVTHLPGHTDGSVCLYCPQHKILFGGDNFNRLVFLAAGADPAAEETEQSRRPAFERWYAGVAHFHTLPQGVEVLAGGHSIEPVANIAAYYSAGRSYLAGEAALEVKTIHLYTRPFLSGPGVNVTPFSRNVAPKPEE